MQRPKFALAALLLLGSLLSGRSADAAPHLERDLKDVSILANAAGGYDVTALVDLKAGEWTAELDFSTQLVLLVNGTEVDSKLWRLQNALGGGTGDCESTCGGGCGGLYVDGVINTMTCRIDGLIPGGGTDCDCGYWLQHTFSGVPAIPGDTVELQLAPSPGAQPDTATSDPHYSWIELTSGYDPVDNHPNYDRRLHSIAVTSSPAGGFDVTPIVGLKLDDVRHVLDLGTEVELWVDGTLLGVQELEAANLDATGDCESGCGGGCGGLYVDGHINTMTCRPDGPLPGGGLDCDCGYWLAPTFSGVSLVEGQALVARVRASGKGAPEVDSGNDEASLVFGGDQAGWNRSLVSSALVADATGGWDLSTEVSVAISDPSVFHDLSFELQVLEAGVVVASQVVDLVAHPQTHPNSCEVDCSGGACADYEASDPFGTIVPGCDVWAGFVGCSCGSLLSIVVEALPILNVADVTVRLRPVPGALPELPGFGDDDEREPQRPTAAPGRPAGTVRLDPARPNPFNPRTTIAFDLPRATSLRLAIYDLRGALVRVLADGEYSAGLHSLVWDGTDVEGRSVASGVYAYRLETDRRQITRKMVLAQ